ncbi:hypothetical protein MKEN_00519500 [Mycena kentingensis (nom. inval.)]|nr:hypothetical protein MKEN_00519500 [Mycena kentingensis (nom. inval.)]
MQPASGSICVIVYSKPDERVIKRDLCREDLLLKAVEEYPEEQWDVYWAPSLSLSQIPPGDFEQFVRTTMKLVDVCTRFEEIVKPPKSSIVLCVVPRTRTINDIIRAAGKLQSPSVIAANVVEYKNQQQTAFGVYDGHERPSPYSQNTLPPFLMWYPLLEAKRDWLKAQGATEPDALERMLAELERDTRRRTQIRHQAAELVRSASEDFAKDDPMASTLRLRIDAIFGYTCDYAYTTKRLDDILVGVGEDEDECLSDQNPIVQAFQSSLKARTNEIRNKAVLPDILPNVYTSIRRHVITFGFVVGDHSLQQWHQSVELLLDLLPPGSGSSYNVLHKLRIAVILLVARRVMHEIRDLFKRVVARSLDIPALPPRILIAEQLLNISIDDTQIVLEPTHYVNPERDWRVLVAQEKDGERMFVVKFLTDRYGEEAHRTMAGLGFAPALRRVEQLPGGYVMVIMDYVPQNSAAKELGETHRNNLQELLRQLQAHGLAHGDLRDANIIVTSDEQFQVIDWDWAGRAGRRTFPLDVNADLFNHGAPSNVRIHGGDPIEYIHDQQEISKILERGEKRKASLEAEQPQNKRARP